MCGVGTVKRRLIRRICGSSSFFFLPFAIFSVAIMATTSNERRFYEEFFQKERVLGSVVGDCRFPGDVVHQLHRVLRVRCFRWNSIHPGKGWLFPRTCCWMLRFWMPRRGKIDVAFCQDGGSSGPPLFSHIFLPF